MRPADVLRLAERERVLSMPVVGDAIARPLLDEIERGDYDLSGLFTITNGGAPLSPTVRERILAALPHLMLLDAVGASESGAQMSTGDDGGRRDAGRHVHPAVRHRGRLGGTRPGAATRARARAGWPAATSSRSAIWATRRRRRKHLPHDRRGAMVGTR